MYIILNLWTLVSSAGSVRAVFHKLNTSVYVVTIVVGACCNKFSQESSNKNTSARSFCLGARVEVDHVAILIKVEYIFSERHRCWLDRGVGFKRCIFEIVFDDASAITCSSNRNNGKIFPRPSRRRLLVSSTRNRRSNTILKCPAYVFFYEVDITLFARSSLQCA